MLLWLPTPKRYERILSILFNFTRDGYGGTEFIICNLFLQKLFIKSISHTTHILTRNPLIFQMLDIVQFVARCTAASKISYQLNLGGR